MIRRAIILLLIAAIFLMGACVNQQPTTSTTTEPPTWPPSYPVHILYIRDITQSANPGGPLVEIALRNASQEPIVSLNVLLKLSGGRQFPYEFGVTASNPMLPDQTIKVARILIGGGWGPGILDSLNIDGTFQSGEPFGLAMIP